MPKTSIIIMYIEALKDNERISLKLTWDRELIIFKQDDEGNYPINICKKESGNEHVTQGKATYCELKEKINAHKNEITKIVRIKHPYHKSNISVLWNKYKKHSS